MVRVAVGRFGGWAVGKTRAAAAIKPPNSRTAEPPAAKPLIARLPVYSPYSERAPSPPPTAQLHPCVTFPRRAEPWRARPDRTAGLRSAVFQFPPQLPSPRLARATMHSVLTIPATSPHESPRTPSSIPE